MEKLLNTLRNKRTETPEFRRAACALCNQLLKKTKMRLKERGVDPKNVVIVIVLRAALAFLDPAVTTFPDAPIGVLGFKRDDRTFKPRLYYENLPRPLKKHNILLLDPMLATGGSAEAAVRLLKKRGAHAGTIYFVGIVAAPEGINRLAKLIPKHNCFLAAVDKGLDNRRMIVPGIGDFGDRYFGYAGRAIISA